MKNLSKTILVIAIITSGLFCQHVQAVQITGNITFAGTCSLNTKSASTATMVTGWHGLGAGGLPQVLSHDGSFNGSVTDGGSGVALLGIALVGIECLRRGLQAKITSR